MNGLVAVTHTSGKVYYFPGRTLIGALDAFLSAFDSVSGDVNGIQSIGFYVPFKTDAEGSKLCAVLEARGLLDKLNT